MIFFGRWIKSKTSEAKTDGDHIQQPARTPPDTRIYAIGDIHGRLDLLQHLVTTIAGDIQARPVANTRLIFLGDYIDRGAKSKEVIAYLASIAANTDAVFLRGNHEQVLLDFLQNPQVLDRWRRYGGIETLESYAVQTQRVRQGFGFEDAWKVFSRRFPASHLRFLEETSLSHTCGDYYFCHAGVNPDRPLERQQASDLLWIREDFLNHEGHFGKMVVHGHTRVKEPEVLPNRINIDTSAYSSNLLTCLVLEDDKVAFLTT